MLSGATMLEMAELMLSGEKLILFASSPALGGIVRFQVEASTGGTGLGGIEKTQTAC